MNNYVNVYPERLPFSLPAESAMFYNNKHDPGPDLGNDIILWMRSLRSALVAGELKTPDDLQKPITNCLGAVALFNSAIDESNDPGYMLLLRSSWQHPDNQTSIHVVSSVFSRYLGSRLYADPTPTAGYLYGTADKIDMLQGDKYVSTDKIIKVNNYFKLLSNDEVSALFEFYYAKALVQSHPEEAYRRLKLVLEKLDESPAYQAKACMLLDNLEQDSIQNNYWLNNRAQLSGIPDKKLDILTNEVTRKRIKDRINYEKEQSTIYLASALSILDGIDDPYEINYWRGVVEMFQLGHRGMGERTCNRISYLDFQGPEPIKRYETFMLKRNIGYCKSDLYR